MKNITFFAIAICSLFGISLQAQVVINEYSASNLHSFLDNYGKTEDWIELYNTSDTETDISGWFLSDKTSKPTKWEIPNGTIMPANGFLVFWCSGRDEFNQDTFHTNFKLSQTSGKDRIVLSDASENIIEDIEMNITLVEHSMAKSIDGSGEWKICTSPTLKTSNNDAPKYNHYTVAPTMSLEAGFYDDNQTVSITNNEDDSVLRYTTNGDNPTVDSPVYSAPITVSKTAIIKAQSFPNDTENVLLGKMDFNTYFINESFTLAVFSVGADDVIDLANGNGELIPIGSIEYFDTNKKRQATSFGSLNRHGQDSWELEHRSIDWISRDEMGYSKAVQAPLFSYSDRDEYQKFMFRNSGDDNYPAISQEEGVNNEDHRGSTHIRDEYVQELAREGGMELDTRAVERVILFLNGKYWGPYGMRERPVDHDYTKEYYKQGKYDLQFLTTWDETKAQYGGKDAFDDWYEIRDFVLDNDMSIDENYAKVKDEINMTSFIDYFVANQNVVAVDWLNYNTGWWRGTNKKGKHKKWGYLLWDMDATFDYYINYTGVPNEGPTAEPCDIYEISDAMDEFFAFDQELPENLSDCATILNKSCPYTSNDTNFIKVVNKINYCCTEIWDSYCQTFYDKLSEQSDTCQTILDGSAPYTMDDENFLLVTLYSEGCCSDEWDSDCQEIYDYFSTEDNGSLVSGNVGKHEKLFIKLQKESPEFRKLYYQRQADLMNTVYSCENMNSTLDRMLAVIEPEMPAQIERWGGSMNEWKGNVEKLKTFINRRCDLLDDGMISCFEELSGPYDLTLNVEPEGAGSIKFNTIKIKNFPWNGAYFGGMDNNLKAKVENDDYKFSHWKTTNGNVISPNITDKEAILNLTNSESLTAVFDKTSRIDNLNQNIDLIVYPNPAQSEFVIEYSLKKSMDIQISLYSTLGQQINIGIENTQHNALGNYKSVINVDKNNITPGVYFVKVKADEFEITQKITIL